MRVRLAPVLLRGLSAAVLPAQAPPEEPTAAEATVLGAAEARGLLLYRYDQAAWHTTDAMFAAIPRDRANDIMGWVIMPGDGDTLRATYFRLDGTTPTVAFSADYDGRAVTNARVVPSDMHEALTPDGQRMVKALLVARAAAPQPCTAAPFNTVVLPPDAAGTTSVYLISAQLTNEEVPLGGQHRIDVGPDGKIVGQRAFTKACLNMPRPSGAAAKTGEPVAAFVTHLLDPVPTELHVFASLNYHLPVGVGTSAGAWMVENGHVRLLARRP